MVTVTVGVEAQPLRITEFMAANSTTLEDEDGDDSDWIEIHNPNLYAVDLEDYALTDDPASEPMALSSRCSPRHTCSSPTRAKTATPNEPLHTNFQLAAGGKYALRAPEGSPAGICAGLSSRKPRTSPTAKAAGQPHTGSGQSTRSLLHDPLAEGDSRGAATCFRFAATGGLRRPACPRDVWRGDGHPDPGRGWPLDRHPAPDRPPGTCCAGAFPPWTKGATPPNCPPPPPRMRRNIMARSFPIPPSPATCLSSFGFWIAHFAAADTVAGALRGVVLGNSTTTSACPCAGPPRRAWKKKPHKFEFHDSRLFRFDPTLPRVDGSTSTPPTPITPICGTGSPTATWSPPACAAHIEPVRLQRNGSFHSLAVMIENVDSRFLRRHRLDASGPLFKATGNGSWLASTAGFETRNGASLATLQALVTGIHTNNPERAAFLLDQSRPAQPGLLPGRQRPRFHLQPPEKLLPSWIARATSGWCCRGTATSPGDIYLGAGDPRHPPGDRPRD